MMRVALSGLLGRKLRTALTAIAIVLGVAMVTGTYVLTDSIKGAFNGIFTEIYRGTDATITGKSAFDLSSDNGTTAPAFDESLLPRVRALPEVDDAVGGVGGIANLVKDGKVIAFGGAPHLGFSVDPTRLTLLFQSFGFKHGIPLDADLVFDVRCLPNPYYEEALAPLTAQLVADALLDNRIDPIMQALGPGRFGDL